MVARIPKRCLGLVWLAACASAPPAAPPPIAVTVGYEFVSPADADSPQTVDNDPQAAPKSMRVEVFALRVTPAIGSIEPQLATVVAEAGAPFRAASSLPPATRWASPPAPLAAGVRVGGAEAVVAGPLATTLTFGEPRLPRICCELTPLGARVTLSGPPGDEPGEVQAVLRQPVTAAAAGLLFVPTAADGFAGHAIVLTITGAAAHAAAVAADAAARASSRRPPAPAAATWQRQFAADAIGAEGRRAAMLAVAAQLGLPPCTDILLAADEPRLIAIGTELTGLDATAAGYAWAFQRAMWTGLLPAIQRDTLPPGMRAAVIRGLGAVAAEPSTLQLHLLSCRDGAAFLAALVEENGYALGDRDPVHRLRAHEWLLAHDHGVDGYDPLAPAAARAAALRAHAAKEPAR